MSVPVIVRLYKGEQLIEVKQFESEQIVVGHNAEVHLDLEDEDVSPIHAVIENRDSGYFICDLGSQSGTKVNGRPVLDEPLSSGDKIDIGSFTLEFYVGVPKPKIKPPTGKPKPQPPPAPEDAAFVPSGKPQPATAPPRPQVVEPPAPVEPTPRAVRESFESTDPVVEEVESPKQEDSSRHSTVEKKAPRWGTFAPPSEHKELSEILTPSKGTVVEVIVAWGDRVLSTHHFSRPGTVTIGRSPSANVVVEAMKKDKQPLIKVGKVASLVTTPEMKGEFFTEVDKKDLLDLSQAGRARRSGNVQLIDLQQGEMAKFHFANDNIDVYVRYVSKAPPVLMAPLFDFSVSEWTGIVLSLALALMMSLYVSLYAPVDFEKDKEDEVVRIAKFIYKKPKPKPTPVPVVEKPKPKPTPVVRATPSSTPTPRRVKVGEKKKKQAETSKTPAKKKPAKTAKTAKKGKSGKTGGLRANKNKKAPKKFGSIKQGGAKKIGKKAAANAKSKPKDVSKMGLLGAFGGGGVRDKIDTSYDGSGEIFGMADRATGTTGQASDRAGKGIGSKLRAVGAGGRGTQTEGISGVATRGRGGGDSGYGIGGGGLGDKGRVLVSPGGQEERFTGTIDREAVRRVVKNGTRQLQSCYEKELNRNPGLSGKIVIQWEIGEQGRVLNTRTQSSTLASKRVARCVQLKIRSWRFPEPPEGVIAVVDFPFVFVSNQ